MFEEITDRIRRDLALGSLKAGDKLPAERDLAQQLGVSRSAVREALRTLEIAGVLELRMGAKGGAFILDGTATLITRPIQDLMSVGRVSMESLTEARILITGVAIRLACERATEEELGALLANAERLTRIPHADLPRERIPVSTEFYGIIARATRNTLLQVIVDSLTTILLQIWERSGVAPLPGLVEARRDIAELIGRRDAEGAAAAMTAHLRKLHEHLIDGIGRRQAVGFSLQPVTGPAGKGQG